jgi:hypothetical protein
VKLVKTTKDGERKLFFTGEKMESTAKK